MARHDDYQHCTAECERMPRCGKCGKIKKPVGRDAPLSSSYCDRDCDAYMAEPRAGHLWPGELALLRTTPGQGGAKEEG